MFQILGTLIAWRVVYCSANFRPRAFLSAMVRVGNCAHDLRKNHGTEHKKSWVIGWNNKVLLGSLVTQKEYM